PVSCFLVEGCLSGRLGPVEGALPDLLVDLAQTAGDEEGVHDRPGDRDDEADHAQGEHELRDGDALVPEVETVRPEPSEESPEEVGDAHRTSLVVVGELSADHAVVVVSHSCSPCIILADSRIASNSGRAERSTCTVLQSIFLFSSPARITRSLASVPTNRAMAASVMSGVIGQLENTVSFISALLLSFCGEDENCRG